MQKSRLASTFQASVYIFGMEICSTSSWNRAAQLCPVSLKTNHKVHLVSTEKLAPVRVNVFIVIAVLLAGSRGLLEIANGSFKGYVASNLASFL